MITEKEVVDLIEEVTKEYKHVLDCGAASTFVNAPRALMQVAAIAKLNTLYTIVGKKRPSFKYDEAKTDT